MYKPTDYRTPLAQAIALALGVATLTPAFAQGTDAQGTEEPAAELEEIVVTGIRASLISAMDIRRESSGVVDAITAEEMGKFPDQNLAEALQRIPGVSIDRFNGEGSRITVRGMGPEFNLVLLNGRTMPTAGGRSFDFNDIASEGVSAVKVFKTGRADLPTGGIGATVNIETARPLDNPGLQGVISGKAVHETSSQDSDVGNLSEVTPEFAGIFSNTFADGRFGILLSGSYQERDNREENASVDNWQPNGQLNGGIVNDNNQREDGTWWHPQNVGYGWSDISRTRINGQAVLQWAPTDRVTATLDYTYSELELEKDSNSVGIWFQNPNVEATINERGTVTQVSQAGGDFSTNIARDHTIKENDSLGLNLAWQATDDLKLTLDAHSSSSELRGGDIGGETLSSANFIIGNTSCPWCDPNAGFGPPTADLNVKSASYGSGGIPTMSYDFKYPDGSINAEYRPSDIGSLFGQAFNTQVENDVDQLQLGGSWKNADEGAISRIDFGYGYTNQESATQNAYSGLLPAGFWLTSAQYWADDKWNRGNYRGLLSGFSNGGGFSNANFFTTSFGNALSQFETIGTNDPISSVYWPGWGADYQDPSGTRGRFWSGPLSNNGTSVVEETIHSLYTQMVMSGEFNGFPVNAVLGLRYDDTSMESSGQEVPATAIVWVGGNEFQYEKADPTNVTGDGNNEFWLPSLDVDVDVMDDVKGRFSYSRSIARPPIGALSPTRTFEGNPNVRNRKVTAGNPELLPYVSDNFDLSLEWYYAPGSYVSAGYFRKKVDNFLISTIVQRTFDGLTDPYVGAAAEQARAQLTAEGIPTTDQNVFARVNQNLGVPLTTPIRAEPDDPLAVFDVTTTTNAEIGNLYGWELAVQHMFGDTGFGIQANATIVSGDVDANRNVINQSFALPGLSDSANFTVFYENHVVSTRLAYNWRDEFLSGFDQYGSPVYNESYQQLDFNATWFATEDLSVFFEAINITEEVQRTYVRYEEQFLRGNQYGARYNIGARYRF
jgi:TonB-dependent receptor